MFAILKLVPMSVWVGLASAVALAMAIFAIDHNGYRRGSEAVKVEWQKERVAYIAALQKEQARQAQMVEKVVIEYRDRVKIVKEKGDEIVKLVPQYVRTSCVLPGAWRVLHDSAASGGVPEDPAGAIAAADTVESLAALETVAANYTACHENAARLTALQQLVVGLEKGLSQ